MPSRPGQSKALLDELLASQDLVAVEAAIARLAIIGRPALRQVLQRLEQTDAIHQPRLLRVLERIGDPMALPAVRPLLSHVVPEVASAAVDAMGTLLDATDATIATAALDALTATLLDPSRSDAVRLRAFDAIANAPVRSASYDADIVSPLREQLRRDASDAVREAIGDGVATSPVGPPETAHPAEERLDAIAGGDLPADTEVLRRLLAAHGATAPLTVLHRVIERVREHEATIAPADAETWRVVRATAHLALAARGSRLAVYDLRETLRALVTQTPVGMLSALQQVGDASVLEAVADAWQDTTDPWFRGQMTTIFRDVVERERLTKRHAAVKKLSARLPEAMAALWAR